MQGCWSVSTGLDRPRAELGCPPSNPAGGARGTVMGMRATQYCSLVPQTDFAWCGAMLLVGNCGWKSHKVKVQLKPGRPAISVLLVCFLGLSPTKWTFCCFVSSMRFTASMIVTQDRLQQEVVVAWVQAREAAPLSCVWLRTSRLQF